MTVLRVSCERGVMSVRVLLAADESELLEADSSWRLGADEPGPWSFLVQEIGFSGPGADVSDLHRGRVKWRVVETSDAVVITRGR